MTMTIDSLIVNLTDALFLAVPAATLGIMAATGLVITLAARFGGRIVKSLR